MGGLLKQDPVDVRDVRRSARWPSRACRSCPASSARTRSWPARSARRTSPCCSAVGLRHRAAHRLLHGAPAGADVPGPLPRRTLDARPGTHGHDAPCARRARARRDPRVALEHAAAAGPAGRGLGRAAGFIDVPGVPAARLPAGAGARGAPRGLAADRWPRCGALLGIAAGSFLYTLYADVPERLARRCRGRWRRVLEAKYGFDAALRLVRARAWCVGGSEALLWKGVDVARDRRRGQRHGARWWPRPRARVRLLQSGLVRGYALLILGGAVVAARLPAVGAMSEPTC